MPFRTHFNHAAGRFEVEFYGDLAPADIFGADEAVLSSEHWGSGKPRLVRLANDADIASFTLDTLQDELMPVIQDTAEQRGAPQKAAFVVTNELALGMVKIWEFLPEKNDLEIFRAFEDEAAAIAWLDEPDA